MKMAEKPRAEPKTDQKLKPAPRAKKNWTKEEEDYLMDKWGTISIPSLAKNLGRSVDAVICRRQKLGCGAHLENDHRVSLNQLMLALYGGSMGTYTVSRLVREGLPTHWHKTKMNRFKVVDMDEFWTWAEQNRMILDFSRFEEFSLGKEPDWVKEKRRADFEKYRKVGRHNEEWAKAEEAKLRYLLKKHEYTYQDLMKELRKSEGAIKRRIAHLGIKERPVRVPSRAWSEKDIETLCTMLEKGYDWALISAEIGRSALACRGKYERLVNPFYTKRYYRGNGSTDYQGIHDVKPAEVLARYKAMQRVDFQELESVKGGE